MLLRSAFVGAASLVAVITGAAASETTSAYASLTVANAAACARACADDGICMAWSFQRDNQCQLSAVVAANPQALAAGFSSRAPAHLQPSTPIVQAEAPPPPPSPPVQIVEAAADEVSLAVEPQEDDLVLLGGPGEGDLRLGLR